MSLFLPRFPTYSKNRDSVPDLAPVLWHSFGTMSALLHEIISIYPDLSPPNLTAHVSAPSPPTHTHTVGTSPFLFFPVLRLPRTLSLPSTTVAHHHHPTRALYTLCRRPWRCRSRRRIGSATRWRCSSAWRRTAAHGRSSCTVSPIWCAYLRPLLTLPLPFCLTWAHALEAWWPNLDGAVTGTVH